MKKIINLVVFTLVLCGMVFSASFVSAREIESNSRVDIGTRIDTNIELDHGTKNDNQNDDRDGLRDSNFHLNNGTNGKVAFVGVISSTSTSGFMIREMKGWTLSLSNATFIRNGSTSSLSSFQIGDRVLIKGQASTSNHIINVKNVKYLNNNSIKKVNKNGTVSDVDSNGFTLSSGNNDFTVVANGSSTLKIGNIMNGMRIKVKGFLNKITSVISAMSIRVHTNATSSASSSVK